MVKKNKIENELGQIEEFSNKLSNATMVLESSPSCYWLYEILSRRHRVVLSNQARTKTLASAKVKTDKVDALMLDRSITKGFLEELRKVARCLVPKLV